MFISTLFSLVLRVFWPFMVRYAVTLRDSKIDAGEAVRIESKQEAVDAVVAVLYFITPWQHSSNRGSMLLDIENAAP